MRLFIVRHGETVWNAEGRFQGQIDTDLNEKGLSQAEGVAAYLKGHPFTSIVSSPLSRAHVTAQKIAAACNIASVRVVPQFTEINHGEWEGCLADDIRAQWPDMLDTWHAEPHTVTMPGKGGENLQQIYDRVVPALSALENELSGDVCLVAHDAVIKVMLCHWLEAPLSSFWRFQVGNCSLSIVNLEKGKPPRIPLFGYTGILDMGFSQPEQKGL